MDAIIQVDGIGKRFGAFAALSDVSLDIAQGEKVVVCGPSGSGKSTLIRCINRLESHDTGTITVDGVRPDRSECRHRPARSRDGVPAVQPVPASQRA